MIRSASIFKRRDGWYLEAISKTSVGVGLSTPPYLKLPNDVDPKSLGEATLQAMEGSRMGIPHPTMDEFENEPWPMLELAGVKTWAAFARRAANAGVTKHGDWLAIEPWRNAGAKMGFEPIPGVSFRVRADAPAREIGEAVRKTIAVSEATP
jgi:hypothetical protein